VKAEVATLNTNRKAGTMRAFTALMFGVALAMAHAVTANAKMPESFADLADQVSPAVVNITTSTTVAGVDRGPQPIVPEGSPLGVGICDL